MPWRHWTPLLSIRVLARLLKQQRHCLVLMLVTPCAVCRGRPTAGTGAGCRDHRGAQGGFERRRRDGRQRSTRSRCGLKLRLRRVFLLT